MASASQQNSALGEQYNAWQGLQVKNTFLDFEEHDLMLLDASIQSAPAQLNHGIAGFSLDDTLASLASIKSRHSNTGNTPSTLSAVAEAESAEPAITTMQIRNIPNRCTKEEVLRHIDGLGFANQFDLFHMPMDKKRKSNLGFAFINFMQAETASLFQKQMKGTCVTGDRAQNPKKSCTVAPAGIQGLEIYIRNLVEGGKPLDLLFVPEGIQEGIVDGTYGTPPDYQVGTKISL
jgi:hypothetical protein